MAEEEYPIHPILDELIQSYKEFKTVVFPRGMPKPVDVWKEILQNLTKYEAHIVLVTGEYLCGDIIKADDLDPPEKLKEVMQAIKIRSAEDSDFLNNLMEYRKQIEAIAHHLQDCVYELGNPCQTFRGE